MNILFMSACTADVIAQRGVLDKDVNFLRKPFSMQELAIKALEAQAERQEAAPVYSGLLVP